VDDARVYRRIRGVSYALSGVSLTMNRVSHDVDYAYPQDDRQTEE